MCFLCMLQRQNTPTPCTAKLAAPVAIEALVGKKHPSREPIASRREHSLALNQSCRSCHAENFEQYEHSIHASLVAEGNQSAPVCTDCHSAHAVESMAVYQPVTGLPCKNCHENIFDAYAQSVHGGARVRGNVIRESHIQAPICSDCHQAHGYYRRCSQ